MHGTRAGATAVGAICAALTLGVLPGVGAAAAPGSGQAPTYRAVAVSSVPTAAGSAMRKVQRHKVHLVLVKGPRGKDSTKLAQLSAAVRQADAFYDRSTGGRIRFKVGKTHGWARASSYCDNSVAGRLADKYRWQPKKYVHVVAYQAVSCPFAGQGSWPGKLVLLARGSSSTALAHELGHNLGLGHADATTCSRALAKACTPRRDGKRATEYADLTDVMGAELGDGSTAFAARPVAGTFNPALLTRLGVPVRTTRVDAATLAAPRSVLLTSRALGGYTTASFRWAGRLVWLSYQPARHDDGSTFPVPGWYRPATTPQVVMHARGPKGSSILIPRSANSEDGAGLPVGATYALPGGVSMATAMQGDAVRLTFTPAP